MPAGLSAALPTLTAFIAGQRMAGTHTATYHTRANHIFTHFAKSGSAGIDLYEDFVQPSLGLDMFVETWRRSPQMETYCRSAGFAYDSMNIETLQFLAADGSLAPFKYTQDHSKIAVTAANYTGETAYVCQGDINRMTSQWARGGGTLCWRFKPLYSALIASITSADACP